MALMTTGAACLARLVSGIGLSAPLDNPVRGEYEYEFAREMLCGVPDRCHTAKGSCTGNGRAYWSFISCGGESMRCASWVTAIAGAGRVVEAADAEDMIVVRC